MKKNINIFATLVLITGLMAPSAVQASGLLDTVMHYFGAGFGANLGVKAADSASHHLGEMIPDRYKKILVVAGIVGVVGYVIYSYNRGESTHHQAKRQHQARTCSNKGCSHKKCK
jgi:hypothetical protein